MLPLILYLVNHCVKENLIANIRCSLEPLLDPDLCVVDSDGEMVDSPSIIDMI